MMRAPSVSLGFVVDGVDWSECWGSGSEELEAGVAEEVVDRVRVIAGSVELVFVFGDSVERGRVDFAGLSGRRNPFRPGGRSDVWRHLRLPGGS